MLDVNKFIFLLSPLKLFTYFTIDTFLIEIVYSDTFSLSRNIYKQFLVTFLVILLLLLKYTYFQAI